MNKKGKQKVEKNPFENMTEDEFFRQVPRKKLSKPQGAPSYSERAEGPTPNGGAYSMAFYYDDNGNPAPKSEATRCNIIEFDENDNFVNETMGILGKV